MNRDFYIESEQPDEDNKRIIPIKVLHDAFINNDKINIETITKIMSLVINEDNLSNESRELYIYFVKSWHNNMIERYKEYYIGTSLFEEIVGYTLIKLVNNSEPLQHRNTDEWYKKLISEWKDAVDKFYTPISFSISKNLPLTSSLGRLEDDIYYIKFDDDESLTDINADTYLPETVVLKEDKLHIINSHKHHFCYKRIFYMSDIKDMYHNFSQLQNFHSLH